jgi:hypothetical protein
MPASQRAAEVAAPTTKQGTLCARRNATVAVVEVEGEEEEGEEEGGEEEEEEEAGVSVRRTAASAAAARGLVRMRPRGGVGGKSTAAPTLPRPSAREMHNRALGSSSSHSTGANRARPPMRRSARAYGSVASAAVAPRLPSSPSRAAAAAKDASLSAARDVGPPSAGAPPARAPLSPHLPLPPGSLPGGSGPGGPPRRAALQRRTTQVFSAISSAN